MFTANAKMAKFMAKYVPKKRLARHETDNLLGWCGYRGSPVPWSLPVSPLVLAHLSVMEMEMKMEMLLLLLMVVVMMIMMVVMMVDRWWWWMMAMVIIVMVIIMVVLLVDRWWWWTGDGDGGGGGGGGDYGYGGYGYGYGDGMIWYGMVW